MLSSVASSSVVFYFHYLEVFVWETSGSFLGSTSQQWIESLPTTKTWHSFETAIEGLQEGGPGGWMFI